MENNLYYKKYIKYKNKYLNYKSKYFNITSLPYIDDGSNHGQYYINTKFNNNKYEIGIDYNNRNYNNINNLELSQNKDTPYCVLPFRTKLYHGSDSISRINTIFSGFNDIWTSYDINQSIRHIYDRCQKYNINGETRNKFPFLIKFITSMDLNLILLNYDCFNSKYSFLFNGEFINFNSFIENYFNDILTEDRIELNKYLEEEIDQENLIKTLIIFNKYNNNIIDGYLCNSDQAEIFIFKDKIINCIDKRETTIRFLSQIKFDNSDIYNFINDDPIKKIGNNYISIYKKINIIQQYYQLCQERTIAKYYKTCYMVLDAEFIKYTRELKYKKGYTFDNYLESYFK